jgi:hypothetical protein
MSEVIVSRLERFGRIIRGGITLCSWNFFDLSVDKLFDFVGFRFIIGVC